MCRCFIKLYPMSKARMSLSKILPQTSKNFTQIYLPYLWHYATLKTGDVTGLIPLCHESLWQAGLKWRNTAKKRWLWKIQNNLAQGPSLSATSIRVRNGEIRQNKEDFEKIQNNSTDRGCHLASPARLWASWGMTRKGTEGGLMSPDRAPILYYGGKVQPQIHTSHK